MAVNAAEASGKPFSLDHCLYLGDLVVELVILLMGGCKGAGACVAWGSG